MSDFVYLMRNLERYNYLPQETQQAVFSEAVRLLASKTLNQEQEGQLRRAKDAVVGAIGLGDK